MSDSISRADAIDAIEQAMINHDSAIMRVVNLPSAEPEIIRCKDCSKRYDEEGECPMLFIESVTYDDDGYIEVDDIWHDNTKDEGFCDRAERREDENTDIS